MLIIFDQPLFELLTLLLCGQSLLFKVDTYCSRTEAYCYGVKPIIISNNLLFSIVFVKERHLKSTHFWITLPYSSFENATAYQVSITPDITFIPIVPVYFFSYCSRIMTYCFLLCLSKRGLWC